MRGFLREIIVTLIIAVVIFFLLHATVQVFSVKHSSMEPGLEEEQRILVNKVVYFFHEPERGEVVIFDLPFEEDPFIKRIIGLPGESVEIEQGIVYIHKEDGSVLSLDEPYIKEAPNHPFNGDTIPENEYFMLGDNRNNSSDSRIGWTVKREDIIGKAWLLIGLPKGKWGLAPNYLLP